jgi:hypothetical protein
MRKALFSTFLFCSFSVFAVAVAAVPTNKTTVVYFGQAKADEFESKIKPLFDEKARCKNCELVNYTPYTKEGALDVAALQERIDSLPSNTSFVFFDFNLKVHEATKPLIETLNKRTDLGLIVVGSAGVPKENEASGPLSKTVLGQVRGALIIGELGDRDRLVPNGFYGPEMLTALRPPKDMIGQGYSPLIFAANLADRWDKRSSQEWNEFFRTKKMKTRKIWLDLGDLF